MQETMREIMSGVEHDPAPKPRRLANNTVEYHRNGQRIIRLHHTDILTFSGKNITLNSGGWKTVTTKDRLNAYLPNGFRVWSDKGSWLVFDTKSPERESVPFFDGIVITNGKLPKPTKNVLKAETSLKAKIKKFADKLDTMSELPKPSSGDCWYCSMFDRIESSPQRGMPGDATGNKSRDPSHLRSHIDEGYLHGSLLLNAMRWNGWTDARIGIAFQYYNFKQDGRYRSEIKRALRRFLQAQLGLTY